VVRELLNHGANVNTANKDGFTSLHLTGLKGYVDVVIDLLKKGANVNTANKRGDTPLYITGGNGHVEVVRELLNHGVNVNHHHKHPGLGHLARSVSRVTVALSIVMSSAIPLEILSCVGCPQDG
jgi:ankyrin repeat protein